MYLLLLAALFVSFDRMKEVSNLKLQTSFSPWCLRVNQSLDFRCRHRPNNPFSSAATFLNGMVANFVVINLRHWKSHFCL